MGYNIGSNDDGDDDDDDEQGSRALPSRTFAGGRAAFGEKFPYAIKPRRFFFFWEVDAWVYRCVYSIAKTELMYDLPSIKYTKTTPEDKEDEKGKLKGKKVEIQTAIGKNQETLAKIRAERIAKAKKEKEEGLVDKKVSMSQLLNKRL